jgi:hypothetical protein
MAGQGAAAGPGRPRAASIAWGTSTSAGNTAHASAAAEVAAAIDLKGCSAADPNLVVSVDSSGVDADATAPPANMGTRPVTTTTAAGPGLGVDVRASAPALLSAGVSPETGSRMVVTTASGWELSGGVGQQGIPAAGAQQPHRSMPEAMAIPLADRSVAAGEGTGEAPRQAAPPAACDGEQALTEAGEDSSVAVQQGRPTSRFVIDVAAVPLQADAAGSSSISQPHRLMARTPAAVAASSPSLVLPSTVAPSALPASSAGSTGDAAFMRVSGWGGSGKKLGISSLAVGIGPGFGLGSGSGGPGVQLSPVSRLSLGESVASDTGRPSLSTDSEPPSRHSLGGVSTSPNCGLTCYFGMRDAQGFKGEGARGALQSATRVACIATRQECLLELVFLSIFYLTTYSCGIQTQAWCYI